MRMTQQEFFLHQDKIKKFDFSEYANSVWFPEAFKNLVIIVLILAIAIPLRYGSTNPRYLSVRLFHLALSLKHSIISDSARPTLSADYRAFEDLLRMKPLSKRDPTEDSLTIVKRLRSLTVISNLVPKPSQCQITKEVFEHDDHTVDTYWIDNHQREFQRHADHIIVYFHGGGYMLGDINSYSGIECHFSKFFNISILHVEYRLSPEYPLPSPVEDTVAVYRALLSQNISPSRLIFMGDSAGGGLCLLTIQSLITNQLPVPRGVIVLSPWTDISASSESHIRNRHTDVMINMNRKAWIIEQLLGPNHAELSPNSSVYSPLFGSFEGFPPMYINVGTAEILEDDSRLVLQKAQEADVDVTFEEGLHLMHVYPVFFSYFPEARSTLHNINQWLQTIYTRQDP